MSYEGSAPVIEDVRDHFPDAIKAEKKGLNVLVLCKMSEPETRVDGKRGYYELIHKWLSENNVSCVRGSERTLWLKKEVDLRKNLFDQFNLF